MDIISPVAIAHFEARRQREFASISSVSTSHGWAQELLECCFFAGLPKRA